MNSGYAHTHEFNSTSDMVLHLSAGHHWFDSSDTSDTGGGRYLPASELLVIHRELHRLRKRDNRAMGLVS